MQAAIVISRRIAQHARLGSFRRGTSREQRVVNELVLPFRLTGFSSRPALAHWASSEGIVEDQDEVDERVEYITAQSIAEMFPHRNGFQRRDPVPWGGRTLDLELGEDNLKEDENRDYSAHGLIESENDVHKLDLGLSPAEMLNRFDPQNPPPLDRLEELQLWLECEAQQEAVLKYRKVIESARKRKDYSSLSLVQRQVLWWFQPLVDSIEKRQKEYIFREKSEGDAAKSAQRFGPFLCTLPPAKLAVITAHTAIMETLTNSSNSQHGTPFTVIARQLGQAVEDEVIIQRVLHQRYKESQARASAVNVANVLDGEATEDETDDEVLECPTPIEDELSGEEKIKALDEDPTKRWTYSTSHLQNYLDELKEFKPKSQRLASFAIWRARQVLENDEQWTERDKIQLGAALFKGLLDCATVKDGGSKNEPAFTFEKRWTRKDKSRAYVSLNEKLRNMVVSDRLQSFSQSTTRQKPMILPPKPWTKPKEGGYLWLKSDIVRYHGCDLQLEALNHANLNTVYDGLNSLAKIPWVINKRILEVAEECWARNISIGDIPSKTDFEVPPEPLKPERPLNKLEKGHPEYDSYISEMRAYREARAKYDRMRQKNSDLVSLRCSVVLKLDQAGKFKDFKEIYFPYNMDFRGRVYPLTPHLSIVGSDLCRGLLKFSVAKPLGTRGLFWLKVHLANFAGKDKVTLEERAAYIDENIDKVRASIEDPFGGDRWWMTLDDPFQGLAACAEIIAAIDSGDPESYMCNLPVHMDGSCNGLQHYAALGRDAVGGKAVNLRNTDKPQDVYSGVMEEVIRRVAEEASQTIDFDTSDVESLTRKQKKILANNRAAKLVDGLIDRGVVKRTVMTSVYGVTYIGARQQIQEKIEEKLEGLGCDIDEMNLEVFRACGYLARVTMEVMGQVFTGAKETMNWLTTCARMITQLGYPVAWISPIGLPAIQPYRRKKSSKVVTLMQVVSLIESNDDLPLHTSRQVSAFPPNFVHSLDASHMLFTALEMDRRGLSFSAVHDSFWTHPCDIDEMNKALRDTFIELYERPLLEEHLADWKMRYPDLEFPPLPERGDLDLNEVRSAKYFFQ